MMIKVAKLGSAVTELFLEDESTVAEALEAAGIALGSSEVAKVNNNAVDDEYSLRDGDLLTIVPNVKGGSGARKFVKLARLGTAVTEYFIENGHTVADILRMASITLAPEETVKVNNEDVPQSTVVQDGDLLTVVPRVKGGRA